MRQCRMQEQMQLAALLDPAAGRIIHQREQQERLQPWQLLRSTDPAALAIVWNLASQW